MYAQGADLSQMRYTDTMQPNPLYRGSSGGRGLIDIDSGAYRNPQFTQTMNTPWGQMDPNQFYRQRDAFIQTANDQAGRYMSGAGTSGVPGATPQFSPNDMWRQAGNMADHVPGLQGWQMPDPYQNVPIPSPYQNVPIPSPYQNVPIPSTFRPGMAQPTQPQSQGTPYGVTPATPGMAQPPGSRVDDWRQSDAYRQYQQGVGSGPRSTVVGQSSDGSMFGYQAEARAYDAWRQGQPQAMPRNPAPAPKNQFTGPWTGGPIASPGRVMGGNRPSGPAQSWGQQHAANIASPANKSWMRGMTPANRQVYGMMQKMY
jgi:hypothetical protein